MIVGFDHDDSRIFKEQLDFIQQTDIMHAMVGMLGHPQDPAARPVAKRGPAGSADEQPFGTNVIPLGMTREELRDGYVGLMQELYEADFYFDRLENLYQPPLRFRPGPQRLLAETPAAEVEVAVARTPPGRSAVPTADEEHSRP